MRYDPLGINQYDPLGINGKAASSKPKKYDPLGVNAGMSPDDKVAGYGRSAMAVVGTLGQGMATIAEYPFRLAYDVSEAYAQGKENPITTGFAKASDQSVEEMSLPMKYWPSSEEERQNAESVNNAVMWIPTKAGQGWGAIAELLSGGSLQSASDVAEGKSQGSSIVVPIANVVGQTAGGYAMGAPAVKALARQVTTPARLVTERNAGKAAVEAIQKAEALPARTVQEAAVKTEAIKAANAIVEKATGEPPPTAIPVVEPSGKVIEDATPDVVTPESQRLSQTSPDTQVESTVAPETQNTSSMPSVVTNDGTTTSIKNAVTMQERGLRSLPDVEKDVRRSLGSLYEEGKSLVESSQVDPRILAREIANKPREITGVEVGVLAYARMRLKLEHQQTMAEIEQAINKGDVHGEQTAKARLAKIEEDFDFNDQADVKAGTKQSEAFNARKMIVREDYTLAAIIQRAKVDLGVKELPPEVRAKYEKLSKEIEEANAKVAQLEEANSQLQSQQSLKKVKREVALDRRQNKRVYAKKELDLEFDSLANELHNIFGGTQLNVGLDPTAIIILGKMAKNRVQAGIVKATDVVDSIYTTVKNMGMDVTVREIRDAISGYGITSRMSQEAINIQLREVKGQLRLTSALEDAMSGKVPERSGLQRDPQSNEIRELNRQVHQAMKEQGIDPQKARSPEEQWRTALDSIKSRLRNQIHDLAKQLKTGQKTHKKAGTAYDVEALALKEVRDKLKATLEGIEGKQKMSSEQRIKVATAAIEKSIAEYERRIQQVDLTPQKKANTTPETPELEQLQARRGRLAAIYKGMQKDNRPAKDPMKQKIENAIKAVEKSIATYKEKIANKDLSPLTKPSTTTITPELAKMREVRDGLRVVFQQMQKDARPGKSPEEVALQIYRTRLERQITNYETKMAEGNFDAPKRKEMPADPTSLAIRHRLDKAKRAYQEARFHDRRSRLDFVDSMKESIKEVINTPRSLITSFDVSAPFRQGAFIFLAHPVRGIKTIPDMFRALKSDKNQFAIEQEIVSRDNYPLYERAKLYLSEHGQSLSKIEEVYQSRWAEKIPGVKASQRAYTTFLNKLRADSFDQMLKSLGNGGKVTDAELQAIGNFINVSTGRGNANLGTWGSLMFFAPKYTSSRFELILGMPLFKAGRTTPRVRKMIEREYVRSLIGIGVVLELGHLAGADIETDPRSTDFLKMKFGNTRVDPLAGLSQVSTLLARVVTGTAKDSEGDFYALRDNPWALPGETSEYGKSDVTSVIGRFLRTKLSPFVGSSLDIKQGRDVVGNEVGLMDLPTKTLIPLSMKDIYQAMVEQGVAKGSALSLLALFGMGMNTYGENVEPPPRIGAWGE
jgi:hypothetical protein